MDSRFRNRPLLHFQGFVVAALVAGLLGPPLPPAFAQPSCTPSPAGMIAWWPLDDAEGATSAVDVIGGRDAAFVGTPVPVEGKVGSGLRLNGSTDCLQLEDEDLWDFRTSAFTFEFWLNLDQEPGGYEGQPGEVLVGHSEGPYNVDKYIFALAPGQLELITHDTATGNGGLSPVTPWSPKPGEWHHVALTRKGSQYDVYLDGALEDSEQNLAVLPAADTTPTFGCVQDFWDGWLNGVLDEITVYKRALTADEVAAVAAAGPDGKCFPVQVCGDIDDSGKVTATDALTILKAAVGGPQCDAKPCLCNVDGNDKRTAADALAALRIAVGQGVLPKCDC